ncbi:MAG: hypothetical protein KBT88_07820 [Gammaproteobacteria bacterium]|nr:hypothetical protein [Gammaproteobacteria bacterium]MBQ0839679.1 hypothetical protein [Gammaproteobacteria bacterium]
MADKAKGFWSSIPGILTGIAALITATTGLYIAMNGSDAGTGKTATPAKPSPISEPKGTSQQEPDTASPLQPEAIAEIEAKAKKAYDALAATNLAPLVDCSLFPTVNSTASLMSWSNHYQQQIIASPGDKANITDACYKTIDYRGMAHCQEPNNLSVRQALHETLSLCRTAGIEWTAIEHSSIQK